MKTLVILIFFFLISCGDSPLLNKDDASGKPSVEAFVGKETMRIKNYLLTLKYDGSPELYINNSAVVMVQDSEGNFVDFDGEYLFDLWMPDHGHGSGKIDVKKIDVGIYKLSRISFIMPGDWILRFSFLLNGNVDEQDSWPITF